jgi:hypothetical protein
VLTLAACSSNSGCTGYQLARGKPTFDQCGILDDTVPLLMSRTLFSAPTREQQLSLLTELIDGTQKYGITPGQQQRRLWLKAGNGKNFPTVKDVDTGLVYLTKVKAASAGDLDAMPAL